MPLIEGGVAIGVLAVAFFTPNLPTLHEGDLLRRLGNEASLAIGRTLNFEDLSASRERYRTLFERATIGIATLDLRTGHFLDANIAYRQMTGYSLDELHTMTYRDVLYIGDLKKIDQIYHALKEGGSSDPFDQHYVRKDGSGFYGRMTMAVHSDMTRNVPTFIIMVERIPNYGSRHDEDYGGLNGSWIEQRENYEGLLKKITLQLKRPFQSTKY